MNEPPPDDPAAPAPGRPAERSRDRGATETRILDAAQAILLASGPAGFGVNAVARAAGVDKQLIYRYFGGLDGLLAALGARIGLWWQERLDDTPPGPPPARYGALVERLALRLLHVLRTEPLARESALWELTDRSGLVRALSEARAAAIGGWLARRRGALEPPPGIDAPAVNALLVAGVSYLVLAARSAERVVGLATDDPATWDRVEAAVTRLVRAAYG